ncbi:hypothetical protein [Lysinibacillus xylanilyticus]|uniref:hypothetical protein n=1 Tax=Lysinibacillus xylanilyticus TaxID=582475 RepID=UPI0036DFA157
MKFKKIVLASALALSTLMPVSGIQKASAADDAWKHWKDVCEQDDQCSTVSSMTMRKNQEGYGSYQKIEIISGAGVIMITDRGYVKAMKPGKAAIRAYTPEGKYMIVDLTVM